MKKNTDLLAAIATAPLMTFPSIFIVGFLFLPFMGGRAFDIEAFLLFATVGTIVFAYPATIILGPLIFFLFRKSKWKYSAWPYLSIALLVTAAIANRELFDKNGLMGAMYLMSALLCSWFFWLIAIKSPSQEDSIENRSSVN
ncbi:MAG: hypothetical protein HWE27_12130 [Gammaproteobacteria bacterium]|nr:hypothetical protein [Gammaproteobacteria bacterium]